MIAIALMIAAAAAAAYQLIVWFGERRDGE